MKKEYSLITEILKLCHNGKALYEDARSRAKRSGHSLNDLCSESKVGISTLWRWKSRGAKAHTSTLEKLERTFKKWES